MKFYHIPPEMKSCVTIILTIWLSTLIGILIALWFESMGANESASAAVFLIITVLLQRIFQKWSNL